MHGHDERTGQIMPMIDRMGGRSGFGDNGIDRYDECRMGVAEKHAGCWA